jgi:hypothetical protein
VFCFEISLEEEAEDHHHHELQWMSRPAQGVQRIVHPQAMPAVD